MTVQSKNLVSAVAAIILAGVIVFGFDVDLFSWIGDPQTLESPATTTAMVTSVIDGDTLEARVGTTTESVRLIGIDAPEIVWPSEENNLDDPQPECFGWEARTALEDLTLNKEVELRGDRRQPAYDDYGRRLAYVYVERELVNQKLLAEGLARELRVGRGYEEQKNFSRVEDEAQAAGLGLWAECE